MLGFDDYADVAARLRAALAGERHPAHLPRDRRSLLPLAPAARPSRGSQTVTIPGHAAVRSWTVSWPASGPPLFGRRLDGGPSAPLKIASGCDRRCTFCAIPSFRGRVHLAAAGRNRGRGELASRAAAFAKFPGQRELIVLRQGSR